MRFACAVGASTKSNIQRTTTTKNKRSGFRSYHSCSPISYLLSPTNLQRLILVRCTIVQARITSKSSASLCEDCVYLLLWRWDERRSSCCFLLLSLFELLSYLVFRLLRYDLLWSALICGATVNREFRVSILPIGWFWYGHTGWAESQHDH